MSDEVSNFLRSVEELKDRRLEEDEARSRELEEKILQEKRERQARRAERARSISPQKSSPANTPPPPSHRYNNSQTSDGLKLTSSPVHDSPGSPQSRAQQNSHRQSDLMGSGAYSSSPTKENEAPFEIDAKPPNTPPSGGPARTPTLSWQRRPTSQIAERPKSRPLSMVAAENAAARSSTNLPDPSEPAATRDQIAQALASKDPGWFRQTADRGQNSAAFRRNQVEDEDRSDVSAARAQLPGMSRASSAEPDKENASPSLHGKLASPLPLTPAQRLDPPTASATGDSDSPSADRQGVMSPPLMSPPSGRISPTRPVSPTKGLGGFVQSAMMKRTDSVKRWSVTSPGGLQRADSVASNRASLDNAHRTSTPQPGPNSRPSSRSKESHSRPTSSQGRDTTPSGLDTPAAQTTEGPRREIDERTSPPVSPSKTMDPRRWSPTKSSSWLEAALNKPESPKPKPTPPPSNQPAWMVELNKAKAKPPKPTGSASDTPPITRKHEVRTGGLMRSSPMGANVTPSVPPTSGVAGRHSPSTSISSDKAASTGVRSSLSRGSLNDATGDGPDLLDMTPSGSGSPSDKVKPATPPKKDFRAGLKPRQPPPTGPKEDDNELKNVFGNLRRTKTQNYVAPDVFKNNILRGKAGLNLTGGPKPREKKDDLKDAILQKKAEFKQAKTEGRGVVTNASASSEKPIPEGLAKKMEIGRSVTVGSRRGSAVSEALSETPSRTANSNRASTVSTLSRRDSADTTITPVEKEVPAPAAVLPPAAKEAAPLSRSPRPGGGALADRFIPALAGMLARGPPPMASGPSKDTTSASGSGSASTTEPSGPGPQLTHMTKSRARGPKRKAPTSVQHQPQPEPEKLEKPVSPRAAAKPASLSRFEKTTVAVSKEPEPKAISLVDSKKAAPEPKPAPSGMITLVDSSKKRTEGPAAAAAAAVIPLVDSSSRGGVRPRSPTKIHEQVAAIAARGQQPASKVGEEDKAEEPVSQPSSPRKLDVKRISKFLDESTQPTAAETAPRPLSPSKTGGRPPPEPRPLSPQKTGGRQLPEPPKKEPSNDKVDSAPVVSVKSGAALFGRPAAALPKPFTGAPVVVAQQPPRSPPKSSSGPRPGPTSPPLSSLSSPTRSPTKYASEVSAMLNDFFGKERPNREYRVDAAEILMKRPPPPPKVNTQKASLFRVSGDGKKQPVPAHHERVLFEREMYLCPHTFTNEAGKKVSEVYFWAGDEVPEATVEDAQVFLNREARSLGGKLVKLRQGKETAEFLQALGGIIIVRRGSSNKYDSLAPNMLCGRRYLGQVVFDEVDFAPNSLCSGFPYLITQQGKCFLWKGKGSDVDELSCARLIGMDLALMGELAEVGDGSEPAEFWNIFAGGDAKPGSADHWRLKPNYDKYLGRLFCSDAANKQQIVEVHPFSQADLSPASIYVLDAFFEMYIVVGRHAQSEYAAFHNALDFAQEYAILASGMEDRPFVPISTVVLEGIPRDMKSVFRKWRDAASPTRITATTTNPGDPTSPGLRRGRSLRIVPLNQALQALAAD